MSNLYSADIILMIHILYVGVVVGSVPLIMIGGLRHWGWVRNLWFRITHLLMIGIVVAESWLGIRCSLTIWESSLRSNNDLPTSRPQDFIASWLDRLLFWHFPHWIFTTTYSLFGIFVLALFFVVPIKYTRIRPPP